MLGLAVRLPGLGAGAQVITMHFIKATFAQTQFIQSVGQRNLRGTESG